MHQCTHAASCYKAAIKVRKKAKIRNQYSIRKTNTTNKKDPQKKHHLGIVSKMITGGLKHV